MQVLAYLRVHVQRHLYQRIMFRYSKNIWVPETYIVQENIERREKQFHENKYPFVLRHLSVASLYTQSNQIFFVPWTLIYLKNEHSWFVVSEI